MVLSLAIIFLGSLLFYGVHRKTKYGFGINNLIILVVAYMEYNYMDGLNTLLIRIIFFGCPLILCNIGLYVFFQKKDSGNKAGSEYEVNFDLQSGSFKVQNIKRGASIIGAAGSGKTESVVYGFLKHFSNHSFCGVIHDYKNFELTEIAYPMFKDSPVDFHIISFDQIMHRVNPISPKYLDTEESVNEVSRILLENLLEQKESGAIGTARFFNDAAEGLIGGLIWKLKTAYPEFCTLPHLIAIYQILDTDSLIEFLQSDNTAWAMADAFISGIESDRQTAGVKSTLANALKKICTQKIFMVLSADEVPLDVNSHDNPSVISIVNNPKYETAYSPVIATIVHTITKQMSVRDARPSFLLLEEAPTIRLLNMHRIPATLRSYGIATIYVMQDKIQNDMLYGEKASRAILSNLSYQFFGKVNDPDTAKYYERFFEIVKKETTSINRGYGLDFDTRVTTGEKEVSKIRADAFFRLKEGEFITYADGKDKKVHFTHKKIERALPQCKSFSKEELAENFEKIYSEAKSIFGLNKASPEEITPQ